VLARIDIASAQLAAGRFEPAVATARELADGLDGALFGLDIMVASPEAGGRSPAP